MNVIEAIEFLMAMVVVYLVGKLIGEPFTAMVFGILVGVALSKFQKARACNR